MSSKKSTGINFLKNHNFNLFVNALVIAFSVFISIALAMNIVNPDVNNLGANAIGSINDNLDDYKKSIKLQTLQKYVKKFPGWIKKKYIMVFPPALRPIAGFLNKRTLPKASPVANKEPSCDSLIDSTVDAL